jgi:hypothetical protein
MHRWMRLTFPTLNVALFLFSDFNGIFLTKQERLSGMSCVASRLSSTYTFLKSIAPVVRTKGHAMKAYEARRRAALFLDHGSRWRCVVKFTPRPLCPRRKNLPYLSDKSLSRPQTRSWRSSSEKTFSPLPRIEPRLSKPVRLVPSLT